MSHKALRLAQLIAPFGPGSLYTDRKGFPHVICGLDHWYYRHDPTVGRQQCDSLEEFEVVEPRLTRLLRVARLRSPAPYRQTRRGSRAPQNALIATPALRFPTWYRNTRTGALRRFRLHTERVDRPGDGSRWQPVRFIAACASGHLSDFPWKRWARCTCSAGEEELYLTDFGGADLSSIRVECRRCSTKGNRVSRTLAGVMSMAEGDGDGPRTAFQRENIVCSGDRPWLGEDAQESCSEALVGALINQTNLYFARTASAIHIPDLTPFTEETRRIRDILRDDQALLTKAKLLRELGDEETGVDAALKALGKLGIIASQEEVGLIITSLLEGGQATTFKAATPSQPEGELMRFRRAEFDILSLPGGEGISADDLEVVPVEVPPLLQGRVAKVHLVERLRETRAFFGFDRLEPSNDPLAGLPQTALAQLFRDPPASPSHHWLPAVVVYGEGIYVELEEQFCRDWVGRNAVWLGERLYDSFVTRLSEVQQTLAMVPARREWAAKYLLVHSIAHALINQLVFECGYSSASLRERLFVSADPQAPMAGLLIYTSAGDSEGTLGGLVRLGRPERFGGVFLRALSRIAWCSADPVCSESIGATGAKLANLGACHACLLLPETACETLNNGLDRAMLVGTPSFRDGGAFHDLLSNPVELE